MFKSHAVRSAYLLSMERIAMSEWNRICEASIRKQKKEAEARYGIRIGQTEIYCVKCGRPCIPGQHKCQDTRLRELHEAKKENVQVLTPDLCKKLRMIGTRKVAVKLALDHRTVSSWIRKGIVPNNYHELVTGL